MRESSVTTKLRVEFKGSQKTSTGKSINDFLHAGSKLQEGLIHVLMRWRRWPYVFAADVEKMFRQINVHADDRKFQCILWESDPTKEPATYELSTVTHGLTCAPWRFDYCTSWLMMRVCASRLLLRWSFETFTSMTSYLASTPLPLRRKRFARLTNSLLRVGSNFRSG